MADFGSDERAVEAEAIIHYSFARDVFKEVVNIINTKFHSGISVKIHYSSTSSINKVNPTIFFIQDVQENNGEFSLSMNLTEISDHIDHKTGFTDIFFTNIRKNNLMSQHIKNVQNNLISTFHDTNNDGIFEEEDYSFQFIVIDKQDNQGHNLIELYEDCKTNMTKESYGFEIPWCNLLDENSGLHKYFFSSTTPQQNGPEVTSLSYGP